MEHETVSGDDPFSDYKRNEQEEMLVAPPLDLSFKKASNFDELTIKRAQTIRTRKAPVRTSSDRFITSSVWLGNNYFKSMDGIERFVKRTLEDYTYLCWLDFSFNEITEIADEISSFPNLKILYLHGNNISDINNVSKLKPLLNLRSFTLHGNPVESIPCYRGYVVHTLPRLSSLDFSRVLAAERKKALPVGYLKMMNVDT